MVQPGHRVGRGLIRDECHPVRRAQYTLAWDGKDDSGQLVKQGKYTVLIEAAREHGSHQLIRQTMDFNGKVKQQPLNGNVEIASAALDYHEKSATH